MPRAKTFNYSKFHKAVAERVPKHKQWLISSYMVDLGYAIKEKVDNPYPTVVHFLKPGVILTQEDVDKVVEAMR